MNKKYVDEINHDDYKKWEESVFKITSEILDDMWEEQQNDDQ